MDISVFGLGYVGTVTAGCLAEDGHRVIGVDVVDSKVELVNDGKSPIIEELIAERIANNVQRGRLKATDDAARALAETEMAIVCIGTPSRFDGSMDHSYIARVVQQISEHLHERREPFHLVIRSTTAPGTMRSLVLPLLQEHSGRKLGDGYEVLYHPEFLREGSSVHDFNHPPKIVVGECRPGSSAKLLEIYGDAYEAPRIICAVEVAEMVKYCDNLFHAVKVTFANEIGRFCHAHGIDSHAVMDIFCQDKKLNISPTYLKPGFAFGGSCLPKDLRSFLAVSHQKLIKVPMIEGVLESNRQQVVRAFDMVLSTGCKKIGFHGIAFKPGTDDLRESPYVELAERLLGKGCELVFYDEQVEVSRLTGHNKQYIAEVFPHLVKMVTDRIEALADCQVVLICHRAQKGRVEAWKHSGIKVIDLTGDFSGKSDDYLMCIV